MSPAPVAKTPKLCLATVVSDPFVLGAIVLLNSFLAKNPWFDGDIAIISEVTNSPLSRTNRTLLKEHFPKLKFRDIDASAYEGVFHFAETVVETPARLRAAFYILECFTLTNYDRVVALDSDMLVTGDLRELFETQAPFSIVRAYDHDRNLPLPYFNTGTMVIGGECLRRDMVAEISEFLKSVKKVNRSHGKADQSVLNVYFRGRDKNYLDEKYNFSKRLVPPDVPSIEDFLAENDVRILHFLGEKPWNIKIKEMEWDYRRHEELWLREFLSCARPVAVSRLVRELVAQDKALRRALQRRYVPVEDQRVMEKTIERAFAKRTYASVFQDRPKAASDAEA